jgi:hypothetical protein
MLTFREATRYLQNPMVDPFTTPFPFPFLFVSEGSFDIFWDSEQQGVIIPEGAE